MTDQHRHVDTAAGQSGEQTPEAAPAPDDTGSSHTAAGGPEGQQEQHVSTDTVESVIRGQLAKALGGKRGMLEAAVPTIAFTVTYLSTRELNLALGLGIGAAVVLGLIRLVQRSSIQFVFNSLLGIGIAAVFALRSGEAEDAFLPGIIYNAVYALVLILTVLIRWPAVGLLIGAVTGQLTEWRDNPAILKLSSRLTWLLVLPCVIRVLVQYPLWAMGSDALAWLGAAKILMGWPLQVAALAAMVWLLARGRTPMDSTSAAPIATASPERG
ncbi:DUF3159 domain-containing protein [Salinactinospora qingdaonensis]|uniref:DUF3159 domain-containing protein n=1 Tax=Salinactinospora qingdaonensis TaxID=702744 RepID=A0ABP7EZM8_9ACTN